MPEKCKVCGYIHPNFGECQVKKIKELSDSEKGKKIVRFTAKLSRFLDENQEWESIIEQINEQYKIEED